MRYLLIAFLILISFTGCQSKEHETHNAKANLVEENKTQKETSQKFSHMGVNMHAGSITIDTNKTKDFLKILGEKMNLQMKQISTDLQKGMINAQEGGIEVDNGNIHIDLNKTQKFFGEWSKKLEGFAKEFDDIAKTIENNSTKETH